MASLLKSRWLLAILLCCAGSQERGGPARGSPRVRRTAHKAPDEMLAAPKEVYAAMSGLTLEAELRGAMIYSATRDVCIRIAVDTEPPADVSVIPKESGQAESSPPNATWATLSPNAGVWPSDGSLCLRAGDKLRATSPRATRLWVFAPSESK